MDSSSMDSSMESESDIEGPMEFLHYFTEFSVNLHRNYPDKEEFTIEEYLETLALHPPVLEEFVTPKDFMESEGPRLVGNKIFNETRDYAKAATMYTKCLMHAHPYSKGAALAYANRSAALYHMKLYRECILDIDRALELPYPGDLREKVISRREAAVADLENNSAGATKKDPPVKELKYDYEKSDKLLGATSGIDMAYNPQEGRKLIARMPFQSGDVLLVEDPYLTVPQLGVDPTFCHHCFKNTFSLIPCEKCNQVVYCSEKCRGEAHTKYHRTECPIQSTLTGTFPLHEQSLMCVLRCLNILTDQGADLKGLYEDVGEIEESSDPTHLGFTGDKYISNTRKAFLSFLSSDKMKFDPRLWFEAAYLVVMLRNYTDFFSSNKDVVIVAKLLLKLNLAYEKNHLSIPYPGKQEDKAHAAFPLLGLARHACVNNTITYMDADGRIVMRASQFIRPGDEILYDYHDLLFSFEEAKKRTGKTVQCKRICTRCDKTYVYPPERQPYFKLDKRIRSKLQKNPYDIDGLWKVLNIVRGKHQHYTLQAQMVKTMLVQAYEGRESLLGGHTKLNMFGIL